MMTRLSSPVTTAPTPAEPWLALFNEAAGRGFTIGDFARIVAALTSGDRRAAYCDWLATEDRAAVRRGLIAGLAAMEVA